MKPTVGQLESLLALKRHERPEEGYWRDFLCEFHQRQHEQAAAKSGFSTGLDRVFSKIAELRSSKWIYGAGLAYAAVTVGFFLIPKEAGVKQVPAAPVHYQVVPAPAAAVEQLEQLDLSPTTQGSAGEQVF